MDCEKNDQWTLSKCTLWKRFSQANTHHVRRSSDIQMMVLAHVAGLVRIIACTAERCAQNRIWFGIILKRFRSKSYQMQLTDLKSSDLESGLIQMKMNAQHLPIPLCLRHKCLLFLDFAHRLHTNEFYWNETNWLRKLVLLRFEFKKSRERSMWRNTWKMVPVRKSFVLATA